MRKRTLYLAAIFALVMVCILTVNAMFLHRAAKAVTPLTGGWTIRFRGAEFYDMETSRLYRQGITDLMAGEELELSRTLPDMGAIDFPVLYTDVQHAAVQAFLRADGNALTDAEPLLSDRDSEGGIHFFSLPADYAGKTLTLKLTVTKPDVFRGVFAPHIGSYAGLTSYFVLQMMVPIGYGVFLIVYGIAFLMIAVTLSWSAPHWLVQVTSALLSVDLAVWALCRYHVTEFIMQGRQTGKAEQCALFLSIPLLHLMLYALERRRANRAGMAVAVISTVVTVLYLAWQFAVPTPLSGGRSVIVFLALVLALSLLATYYALQAFRDRRYTGSEVIQMGGLLVVCYALFIDQGLHFLMDDAGIQRGLLLQNIFPVGMYVFVVTQLLNYFVFVAESYARQAENQSLSRIAYEDALTGLPNRAGCERYMELLEDSGKDYCVISLDLNGLKETNDRHGHACGDRLLKTFGAELKRIFDDTGFAGRYGGDEFVVLVERPREDMIAQKLQELQSALSGMDARDAAINHSVSYGYAFLHEIDADETSPLKVYRLADERMYRMKQQYYGA